MIDQWMALWKLRNEQRHGADQARHSRIREHALGNELRTLYSFKDQVCPLDTNIFYDSVEAHMQHNPNLDQIETWISIHKDAILASSALAQRLGIRRNRTLCEYPAFNPIAPAREPPREPPSLTAGGLPS